MIPIFIEASLRSLLAGLAVAAGLRIFRVRNVLVQKAAWCLVLVSAFSMPLLLPITAQWRLLPADVGISVPAHPMTLLEELQARIVARGGSGIKLPPTAPPAPARVEEPSVQAAASEADGTPVSTRPIVHDASPKQKTESPAPMRHLTVSPIRAALTLYCGIAALFLLRIGLGLFTTIRLWRTAAPIPAHKLPDDAASVPLRASGKVTSPHTVGSAILLPADYATWDNEKLRIVLAHERSHIRQGDFYLLLLARVYAALAWFSPLGWWLKHELAELAEAISDRAGMEEAASCTSYAQILLEFAAAPRQVSIGVAMARSSNLSRRIERLLNDRSFRQCFAGTRRAIVAVALVPLALLASTTLVHVQAARQSSPSAPAAVSISNPAPAFLAAPQLNTMLAGPQAPDSEPASIMLASAAPGPALPMTPAAGMVARGEQEGGPTLTFDRTLSVGGNPQLMVSTGSGDIHITRGSGSQIHIHGQIHVNREGSEEQARQIAANPPIEQSGDTISVGEHQEQWHNISINYEIEAPEGTVLGANSGSGNIVDEGVGKDAKLQTGSGDIQATSLEGPFTVKTGSGNISAAQTGEGNVVAETGSGNIELKDIHGSFNGQTGSGDIKASGTPSASWILQTGSGSIELWTGNAPLTLDASTGSGSVRTEHQMVVQGNFDHHHVHGDLNGGGPTVRVQTGSGDVQIH